MQSAITANVRVLKNITEIHTLVVDQNVLLIMTALETRLVFAINVLIRVKIRAVIMLYVMSIIIYQCAAALKEQKEMHLLDVLRCNKVKYFSLLCKIF